MTPPLFNVSLNTHQAPVPPPETDPRAVLDEITTWPGYRPTPLVALGAQARKLNLKKIWYKHEGPRFGVGSFKPMGAGYAVSRVVARHIEGETGRPRVTAAQLLPGPFSDLAAQVTVACATDGNHGRAVAWAARLFGCQAVVYVASHVSDHRCEAIASYGAEVVKTRGNHDEAVDKVANDAVRDGWFVISETARASSEQIATDIFSGYAALGVEAFDAIEEDDAPTHVVVPIGVGGLAGGIIQAAAAHWPDGAPRIIGVESAAADAVCRSLVSGQRETVEGALHTVMAGLAAGVVSEYVWPTLRSGLSASIALEDDAVGPALAALADPTDPPTIEAGESGVAGFAALRLVAEDPEARDQLALNASSRVLVIGTEGVTDPGVFESLVGHPPRGD